jgi:hypothetical protein
MVDAFAPTIPGIGRVTAADDEVARVQGETDVADRE